MDLWPHQKKALDGIDDAISRKVRRVVVCSPTGAGKTRISIERIQIPGRKIVFYTNRRMLFEQTSERLHDEEINHGFQASGYPISPGERVQLAMLQTVSSMVKRTRDRVHPADEVIIDEAHHNAGPDAQRVVAMHLEENPECIVIGMTATPLGISHFYDELIEAGTNSELRACGSHVRDGAKYFAPDEPDQKLVGKVEPTGGETAIPKGKRMRYTQRVFGRVVDHYNRLNKERRPAVLFAPGVEESKWFTIQLERQGIRAAHIDSEYCMIGEEIWPNTPDIKKEIEKQCESGQINVVCNRFVLREGIDWPFLYHGIFATVFGSLTSYIQAGGRLLRNHPSMDHVVIQDHGGNYWRHGSLNSDRVWYLNSDDRKEQSLRADRLREGKERKPIVCPKCGQVRTGLRCQNCGDSWIGKTRCVLQADGTLKQVANSAFKARRIAKRTASLEKRWVGRVMGVLGSKKETVKRMTFAQLYASFARDNYWQFPPRDLPWMPINERDWYVPVCEVETKELRR